MVSPLLVNTTDLSLLLNRYMDALLGVLMGCEQTEYTFFYQEGDNRMNSGDSLSGTFGGYHYIKTIPAPPLCSTLTITAIGSSLDGIIVSPLTALGIDDIPPT